MIRLTDLAEALGVTPQSIRNHLKNPRTGLHGNKTGGRQTGEYLLPIDSVRTYLNWLTVYGKQVKFENIELTFERLEELDD